MPSMNPAPTTSSALPAISYKTKLKSALALQKPSKNVFSSSESSSQISLPSLAVKPSSPTQMKRLEQLQRILARDYKSSPKILTRLRHSEPSTAANSHRGWDGDEAVNFPIHRAISIRDKENKLFFNEALKKRTIYEKYSIPRVLVTNVTGEAKVLTSQQIEEVVEKTYNIKRNIKSWDGLL